MVILGRGEWVVHCVCRLLKSAKLTAQKRNDESLLRPKLLKLAPISTSLSLSSTLATALPTPLPPLSNSPAVVEISPKSITLLVMVSNLLSPLKVITQRLPWIISEPIKSVIGQVRIFSFSRIRRV